jgi:hypothetical protein
MNEIEIIGAEAAGRALATRQAQPVDVQRPATQVDALVAAIMPAIQGGTDPAVVREQIALMKDLMAMKAKESFQSATTRFKATVPPVLKTKAVEGLYRYAPLDSVVLQVKAELEAAGFTWSFDQDAAQPGQVTGVCIVTHSGHSERRAVTLPISTGNRASNATKDAAGALSFAQRRAFQNAFGLVIQGDDTDATLPARTARGPGEPPKPGSAPAAAAGAPNAQTKAAKRALWAALKRVDPSGNVADATAWLVSQRIIERGQTLDSLDAGALAAATGKVEAFLETNLETNKQ